MQRNQQGESLVDFLWEFFDLRDASARQIHEGMARKTVRFFRELARRKE